MRASSRTASIGISEGLQGRVLDGLGRPDEKPLPLDLHRQDLYAEPANPLWRDPIRNFPDRGPRVDGVDNRPWPTRRISAAAELEKALFLA